MSAVIKHQCLNHNESSTKLPLNSRHWWVVTYHTKQIMWLIIHAPSPQNIVFTCTASCLDKRIMVWKYRITESRKYASLTMIFCKLLSLLCIYLTQNYFGRHRQWVTYARIISTCPPNLTQDIWNSINNMQRVLRSITSRVYRNIICHISMLLNDTSTTGIATQAVYIHHARPSRNTMAIAHSSYYNNPIFQVRPYKINAPMTCVASANLATDLP